MEQEKIQETLKALECCSSTGVMYCRECPYKEFDLVKCTQKLAAGALAYINQLKKKNEYLEYFLDRQNKDNESMLGPMAWDDIVWWLHNATEVDNVFTIEELKEKFPKLLGHIETEEEPAPAVKSENLPKPRAIYNGYNSHDCEAWYKCPVCDKAFSSWTIYHQKANENNTKNYCPKCKVELSGLD